MELNDVSGVDGIDERVNEITESETSYYILSSVSPIQIETADGSAEDSPYTIHQIEL